MVRYTLERDESVLVIRFEHPPTRNALDRATRVALVDELRDADVDSEVRCVVLTGLDPSFTSGVDARELLSDPDYVPPPVDPPTAIREVGTPVIAAVNGSCVSGGLEIALACSFIVASDRATFADTHARLGLTPGWGLSVELPATIGVARARQMTLTGLPVDAATALAWGLVNEVVPHGILMARAGELARSIAALDPAMTRHALDLYRRGRETYLGRARAMEKEALEAWQVDRGAARRRFKDR